VFFRGAEWGGPSTLAGEEFGSLAEMKRREEYGRRTKAKPQLEKK